MMKDFVRTVSLLTGGLVAAIMIAGALVLGAAKLNEALAEERVVTLPANCVLYEYGVAVLQKFGEKPRASFGDTAKPVSWIEIWSTDAKDGSWTLVQIVTQYSRPDGPKIICDLASGNVWAPYRAAKVEAL